MVFRTCLLILLWAAPAWADADYPAYGCHKAVLVQLEETWLYPEALQERYPGIGPPGSGDLAVFVEAGRASWTERGRDTLRALCLGRWDRARAPRSGTWAASLVMFDRPDCVIQALRPLGVFPRQIRFGPVFDPDVLTAASPTGWRADRLDDDERTWYIHARYAGEFLFVRSASYTFTRLAPDSIHIRGAFEDDFGCAGQFTIALSRTGD